MSDEMSHSSITAPAVPLVVVETRLRSDGAIVYFAHPVLALRHQETNRGHEWYALVVGVDLEEVSINDGFFYENSDGGIGARVYVKEDFEERQNDILQTAKEWHLRIIQEHKQRAEV